MVGAHMATGRIMQKLSPGLADGRLWAQTALEKIRIPFQHPSHRPIVDGTNTRSIREKYRRPQQTSAPHHAHTRQLAIAIERKVSGENR
jgi:hypothetical protein